ncbi:UNVERIFIED_CONTAM: hypothetical protein K2H54_031735 [Gekko kuhli]
MVKPAAVEGCLALAAAPAVFGEPAAKTLEATVAQEQQRLTWRQGEGCHKPCINAGGGTPCLEVMTFPILNAAGIFRQLLLTSLFDLR